jgi:hypothetical protein
MANCIICDHEHDRSVTCNDAMRARSKPAALTAEMLGEEDRKQMAFANLLVVMRLEKINRMEKHNGRLSDARKCERMLCQEYIEWDRRLLAAKGEE